MITDVPLLPPLPHHGGKRKFTLPRHASAVSKSAGSHPIQFKQDLLHIQGVESLFTRTVGRAAAGEPFQHVSPWEQHAVVAQKRWVGWA